MNLSWDDRRTRQFVTNVGLITTDGPNGPNIMAAEWTHHVSYAPSLIAIFIHREDATWENLSKTKEFGVNLAAEGQNWVASVAGGSHGQDVDKISALKELGVRFYRGKKIKAPMVRGAAMNAECKLIKTEETGDHVMCLGKVVEISAGKNTKPLAYHNGMYWKLGKQIAKPPEAFLAKIRKAVEKHKKSR